MTADASLLSWGLSRQEDLSARSKAPPLKITVAPNGARRGHKDHPQLPVSIEEIARDAELCQKAGADEIHLHVRDAAGRHSLDPGLYRAAIAAIEEAAPGLGIQITTEAADRFDVATQMTTLQELRPAAASVAVREIMRSPDLVQRFYRVASDAGTVIQHILYDEADLASLRGLLDQGTVPETLRDVLLVLGRYDPPRFGQVEELAHMLTALGEDFPNWTVCAFGPTEQAVTRAAIKAGGHIRVGFENNLYRPDGRLAANNAENIARAVADARALGRPLLKEVIST